MTKHCSTLLGALAVLTLGMGASPALATGVTKTWVSSTTGNDAGTCQFTSPCKTFAFAITQTLAGGEIDVKEGGSYGPVTISQAVSIVNNGFLAAISVPSGGIGITVNAGANDKVILQGLTIDGHGVGQDGVDFNSGSALKIENCHIRNLSTYGLNMMGTSKAIHIEDSELSDIPGDAAFIGAQNIVNGTISNSSILDSGDGLVVNHANILVVNSTLSGNSGDGVISGVAANILIGQSTISSNGVNGILVNNGTVGSYGDNYLNANTTDIYPPNSLSSVAKR